MFFDKIIKFESCRKRKANYKLFANEKIFGICKKNKEQECIKYSYTFFSDSGYNAC